MSTNDRYIFLEGFFMSMVKDVWESVFVSGVNKGVIRAMNISFVLLFLCLAFFAFVTNFNIHVCALNLVAYALFASVQWFLVELNKVQLEENKSASNEKIKPGALKDNRARTRTKKMD